MKINQGVQENRVRVAANICIEAYHKLAAQMEQLKRGFLTELRDTLEVPDKFFRLVLNEAAALAWQTDYPHLVFPDLATEKIQAAAEWNTRQKRLRQKHFVRALSN